MKNSFHSDNFICLINATSQALTLSNDLTQSPSASHSRLIRKMHHIGCIRLIFWVHPIGSVSQVLCTHRRVTPALGARLLRSYVPLRYGPSESGCASNTYLPADTLLVRKFRLYSAIYLHAASAATAPSAAAVVSCLTSFVRQSPAAKIPGQEVMQSSAASMNPLPSSFTTSAKSSF